MVTVPISILVVLFLIVLVAMGLGLITLIFEINRLYKLLGTYKALGRRHRAIIHNLYSKDSKQNKDISIH